jgi:S1-C subfamily serine protease
MIKEYFEKVVRIQCTDLGYDWEYPFKIKTASQSSGSGFFIDGRGHILTCFHVVRDAQDIKITIPHVGQEKTYSAIVLGVCPFFDLALLEIQGYQNTKYFDLDKGSGFRNKDALDPGDATIETIALGFPLGQNNLQMTKGILSGQQYNFYQTDTPINHGNSGGPLLYQGNVIAVNAAGVFLAQNVNFAVPIYRFIMLRDHFYKKKLINFPENFGFEWNRKNDAMNEMRGYQASTQGIYVYNILEGSPISRTKLRRGDILCAINEHKLNSFGNINKTWMNEKMDIDNLLAMTPLGQKIRIEFLRDDKMLTDEFVMEEVVSPVRTVHPAFEKVDYVMRGGLIFMNLSTNLVESLCITVTNADLSRFNKVSHKTKPRVIISNIIHGGVVEEAKILEKGNLVLKINDVKVETIADVRRALAEDDVFLKVEVDDHRVAVFKLAALQKDDETFSAAYHFPLGLPPAINATKKKTKTTSRSRSGRL